MSPVKSYFDNKWKILLFCLFSDWPCPAGQSGRFARVLQSGGRPPGGRRPLRGLRRRTGGRGGRPGTVPRSPGPLPTPRQSPHPAGCRKDSIHLFSIFEFFFFHDKKMKNLNSFSITLVDFSPHVLCTCFSLVNEMENVKQSPKTNDCTNLTKRGTGSKCRI